MITKTIGDASISVIPEDSDDLLSLRRVIRQNDRVAGDTTRVLKRKQKDGGSGGEYSRPDKGERITVRIALTVQKISLDNVLDKLRISGTIYESSNDSIPHGSHHSLVLKISDGITLHRKGGWPPTEKRLLLASGAGKQGFVLVAIDTAECGIARLVGTHLEFVPNIYSGSGGKMYKTSFKEEEFLAKVWRALSSVCKKGDSTVVFGPGQTKRRLANFAASNKGTRTGHGSKIHTVEGIDSGGEDGIYTFTKSSVMRDIMSDSKLASVSRIIDEVMILAHKTSKKFTMGFEQTRDADRAGAIDALVFSDKAIQDNDEQAMVDLLNDVEKRGAKIYSVDSSTDIGLRVTGLGGIVSLLRYAMP